MLDQKLQAEVHAWAKRNFGSTDRDALRCTLGVCEEAGELAHAILKRDQGIRGTKEEHEAKARDAIGDIAVYLMHLCGDEGWSFPEIVEAVAREVLQRDWKTDAQRGVA